MLDREFSLSFIPSLTLGTAASTKGIIRLSKTESAEISLPQEKNDILFGILLSNGHISQKVNRYTNRGAPQARCITPLEEGDALCAPVRMLQGSCTHRWDTIVVCYDT
jgi:hypothetical protein